ncbi:asparaginase, partial [Kineococcus sp. T90]
MPVATLTRGGLVESVHHGSVAVAGPGGALLAAAGDVTSPVYPRSALKPLQAVAMVRSGLDLPPDLLALACASHSGGPEHLSRVLRVLELAGLGPQDLRNTPDLPVGEAERAAWTAAGRGPQALAQNCSGKHAAMLATCRAAGWGTDGYLDPGHPLQRRVVETVAQLCGEPATHPTADGCGAPLVAVSLAGLARALARIAAAAPGTPEGRVAAAMTAHPELVAGEGRDTTALARAVPGLLAKDGAEGVQVAATAAGAV